jgi:hypothetical protein
LEPSHIQPPTGYEIIPICGNDLALVSELRRKMLGAGETLPPHDSIRAKWLYSSNPAGPADVLGLRHRDDGWVGMVAIVPRQVWIHGAERPCAYLCDFYVNPRHRTLLPALSLQRFANEHIARAGRTSYAIPNERSLPLFKRMGAPRVHQRHRWARPVRVRPFMIHRERRMLSLVSPLIDGAALVFDGLLSVLRSDIQTEWIDQIDSRFDKLWLGLPKKGLCIGDRSAQYLHWRFLEEPTQENRIIGLIDRQSRELVAYAIGRISQSDFSIRDAIANTAQGLSAPMLAHVLLAVRSLRVDAVSVKVLGTDSQYRALSLAGFRSRDPEFAFFRGPLSDEACQWVLTGADEDV